MPPTLGDGELQRFIDLKLDDRTLKAIGDMGFGYKDLTQVWKKAIPPLLAGRDVLGVLQRQAQRNGTGVIVVSPTREVPPQIFGVARELLT